MPATQQVLQKKQAPLARHTNHNEAMARAPRVPDMLLCRRLTGADVSRNGDVYVLRAGGWNDMVVLRPEAGAFDLLGGISLHYAREMQVAHLETSATLRPCVSFKLFLEGAVDAWIEDTTLPMPQRDGTSGWIASGAIVAHRGPVRFRRRAARGTHLAKVVIDIPHTWLRSTLAGPELAALDKILEADLVVLPWQPGPTEVALAERLFRLPAEARDGIAALHAQGITLALISAVLDQVLDPAGTTQDAPLPRDHRWLCRINDTINGLPGGPVNVSDLAEKMNLSPSTLQRMMRRATGQSVQAFVRQRRLAEARRSLAAGTGSIAQIAWQAGYSATANFSTAFRREFGVSPSAVRGDAR